MKSVPLLSLVGVFVFILTFGIQLSSGVRVISSHRVDEDNRGVTPHHPMGNHTVLVHHRVKRQLVAYHRLEAGGILPVLANRRRHGHGGGRSRSAVGEDGTDNGLYQSAGVGYEHKHNDRCEESKCGYNIRHCPHGCVFNSFLCGGGAAYDTCCC